jgi:SAM-dependent methyltransferase
MKAIVDVMRPNQVAIEFLVVGADVSDEPIEDVCGCLVRTVRSASPAYGDILRAMRDNAQGTWLITLDYPMLRDASLIFGFWHRRHEGELLIASRYAWGGATRMPWLRRVISSTLNLLYRKALSLDVRDMSSSRRMYRTDILRQVDIQGEQYDVLVEVLLKFMSHGGQRLEVPWYYESQRHRAPYKEMGRQFMSCIANYRRIHILRNGVGFPDYDYRAFDSRIWFQRYWQRTRYHIIREFTGDTGAILDAGCGSSRIVTTRPDMFAMDIRMDRLRFLKPSNARLFLATIGCLPFKDDTFDVVLTSEVIEHTTERDCIAECARVCKPGGKLVVGTPDYGRIWWPMIEFFYDLVTREGHCEEHITHYTFDMLKEEIEATGAKVVDYRYICGGELIMLAEMPGSPDQ